uniref:Uncharacterized protein n=1 Tax=Arundo donax TaxID=35708 RepID=A0A0A9CI56_ARUDO
MSLRLKQQRM